MFYWPIQLLKCQNLNFKVKKLGWEKFLKWKNAVPTQNISKNLNLHVNNKRTKLFGRKQTLLNIICLLQLEDTIKIKKWINTICCFMTWSIVAGETNTQVKIFFTIITMISSGANTLIGFKPLLQKKSEIWKKLKIRKNS